MYRLLLLLLIPVASAQVCVLDVCVGEPDPEPPADPEPAPEDPEPTAPGPGPTPEGDATGETVGPAPTYAGYDHSITFAEAGSYAMGAVLSALAVWKLPLIGRSARFLLTMTGGMVGWALFSRIEGDKVLDHPTRQQMHDIIQAEPGIHVEALRRRLDIATNTALHHLARLERNGFVQVQRHGGRRRYYAAGTQVARDRDHVVLLRHPTPRRLAKAVLERPGASQTDLCTRLGLRKPAASKHLKSLAEGGLVEVRRSGRTCAYQPTPALQGALAVSTT